MKKLNRIKNPKILKFESLQELLNDLRLDLYKINDYHTGARISAILDVECLASCLWRHELQYYDDEQKEINKNKINKTAIQQLSLKED